MIKYKTDSSSDQSDSEIDGVSLVDFQFSCWASPAVDLQYFLNTSLHESLRPDRFDELIAYYHEHLADFLKRLDYKQDIPTLGQFKVQFEDKLIYGTGTYF